MGTYEAIGFAVINIASICGILALFYIPYMVLFILDDINFASVFVSVMFIFLGIYASEFWWLHIFSNHLQVSVR